MARGDNAIEQALPNGVATTADATVPLLPGQYRNRQRRRPVGTEREQL